MIDLGTRGNPAKVNGSAQTRGVLLPKPARSGEAEPRPSPSLRSLVDHHADFVWRSLRRLGVPEAHVDDALQQVFLVASQKLALIRPGCERSFLFGVASHTAAHVRRSAARRQEAPAPTDEFELRDPSPGPDESMDEARTRVMLDLALDELPDDLRQVFVLYELEEMPSPSIAELLGVPVGTVASRLRRARETFQAAAKRLRTRVERGSSPWRAHARATPTVDETTHRSREEDRHG